MHEYHRARGGRTNANSVLLRYRSKNDGFKTVWGCFLFLIIVDTSLYVGKCFLDPSRQSHNYVGRRLDCLCIDRFYRSAGPAVAVLLGIQTWTPGSVICVVGGEKWAPSRPSRTLRVFGEQSLSNAIKTSRLCPLIWQSERFRVVHSACSVLNGARTNTHVNILVRAFCP